MLSSIYRILLCGIILFFLFSCTEKDQNSIMINPNKILEISSKNIDDKLFFSEISSLGLDSNRNIYIADKKNYSIKKFSIDGNFITAFGKQGNGPGEFDGYFDLCIGKEEIYITETQTGFIHSFDLDGNFIERKKAGNRAPQSLKALSNGNFVGVLLNIKVKDKKTFFVSELNIFNKDYETIKTLLEKEVQFNKDNPSLNLKDLFPIYQVYNKKIYAAIISDEIFQIKAFDENGLVIKNYKKGHIRAKMDEEEIKAAKNINLEIKNKKKKVSLPEFYKNSIMGMWIDKKENLWVVESTNSHKEKMRLLCFKDTLNYSNLSIDILNKFEDSDTQSNLYLSNNLIFLIDNNSLKVEVYDYDY
ncbi:MAG: hypothetical protein CR982_03525 [Candidatus Cloacimonadota bacterium]|nr:MAG: hypothetical protein CR982_03525 [Candidatus Cloacimonadota bacterium]PIE78318.1 MAG: hypothetical protein CSA15_08480 [Candidatus Delongbacteria bacterium]